MSKFFHSECCPKNFILLGVDRDKISASIDAIVKEAKKKFVGEFTSECDIFPFQLRYSAPYERFGELKRLQFEVRNHARFQSDYLGYIAIDLNDFLTHEEEPYFDITLKFLSDQEEEGWKYIFHLDHTNQRHAKAMIKKILSLLRCGIHAVHAPVEGFTLENWAERMKEKHAITFSVDARSEIEPLFRLKSFDREVGDVLMEELAMMYGENRTVIQYEMDSYFSSPSSSIGYLLAESDFELFMKLRSIKKEEQKHEKI